MLPLPRSHLLRFVRFDIRGYHIVVLTVANGFCNATSAIMLRDHLCRQPGLINHINIRLIEICDHILSLRQ